MMAIFAPAGGFSAEVSLKVFPVPGGAEYWACEAFGEAISRATAKAKEKLVKVIERMAIVLF